MAGGEARLHLARAALLVSGEDDAIVSESAVTFPVDSYLQRIQSIAGDFARRDLQYLMATCPVEDPHHSENVLQAANKFLFQELVFRLPKSGRSNMP